MDTYAARVEKWFEHEGKWLYRCRVCWVEVHSGGSGITDPRYLHVLRVHGMDMTLVGP